MSDHIERACVECGSLLHDSCKEVPAPDELTEDAELLRQNIDWGDYPKLAGVFQHRPAVNVYWHELVRLLRYVRARESK